MHFPGSSSSARSEKREERRDHKKPLEIHKLTDSKVSWPLGRFESLQAEGAPKRVASSIPYISTVSRDHLDGSHNAAKKKGSKLKGFFEKVF